MMRNVSFINGWESFTYVEQDVEGVVSQTGKGLYTKNLMNCLCLIVAGEKSYGMLHVNPTCESIEAWIKSLRSNTSATHAIITGANVANQTDERISKLADCLIDLTVIDETKTGWYNAIKKDSTRGNNTGYVGYVALSAVTGEYALSGSGFADSERPPEIKNHALRKGSDGFCTIM